jgi:hypothetical protein
MLIKIDDLKEGQIIKHINIDITFDVEGAEDVDNTVNIKTSQATQTLEVIQSVNTVNKNGIPAMADREYKEVPQEMLDMEF